MSVTQCKEARQHATLTAGIGNNDEWDAPYIVTVSSARDDGQTIVDYFDSINCGLGSPFHYGDREDLLIICKTISPVRRDNSLFVWDVVLHYAPLTPRDDEDKQDEDGNPTDDPLQYAWDISCGTQTFQVPVEKAWNVDPFPDGGAGFGYQAAVNTLGAVVNSAGVVLDPPLMRTIREHIMRVSGNVSMYDQHWADVANCINAQKLTVSATLQMKYAIVPRTHDEYCVLCTSAGAQFHRQNQITYWTWTFEFALRRRASATNPQDGFLETVLDRGVTRIANAGAPDGYGSTISGGDIELGMAVAAAVRDWQQERVPELILLDGHGQPLQGANANGAPPVYFRWRVHEFADGDFLNLPLSIFRAA